VLAAVLALFLIYHAVAGPGSPPTVAAKGTPTAATTTPAGGQSRAGQGVALQGTAVPSATNAPTAVPTPTPVPTAAPTPTAVPTPTPVPSSNTPLRLPTAPPIVIPTVVNTPTPTPAPRPTPPPVAPASSADRIRANFLAASGSSCTTNVPAGVAIPGVTNGIIYCPYSDGTAYFIEYVTATTATDRFNAVWNAYPQAAESNWWYGQDGDPVGRLLSWTDANGAHMFWTYEYLPDAERMAGSATRPDGDLQTLDDWWSNYGVTRP
jgi:outer membrane biosynthesis protein TonB